MQDGIGRYAYELVHPDDRADARAHVRAAGRRRGRQRAAAPPLPDRRGRDALGRGPRFAGARQRRASARHRRRDRGRHRAPPDEAVRGRRAGRHRACSPTRSTSRHGVVALLEVLCSHLDWDLAELWSIDPVRELLRLHRRVGRAPRGASRRSRPRATGEAFEIGDGLQGQAWARRSPIWAIGLQEDPLFRRGEAAAAAGVRSALALPVFRAGATCWRRSCSSRARSASPIPRWRGCCRRSARTSRSSCSAAGPSARSSRCDGSSTTCTRASRLNVPRR